MKKKFLLLTISIVLCCGMVGCTEGDVEPRQNIAANKYLDLVTIYKDDNEQIEVAYDKNTNVMYFMKNAGHAFGITPILNSNGTPKLYEGK